MDEFRKDEVLDEQETAAESVEATEAEGAVENVEEAIEEDIVPEDTKLESDKNIIDIVNQ